MKRKFWSLLTIGLMIFAFSNVIFAQNGRNDRAATAASSMYVISAKAGVVNFVSGKVSVEKKNAKSGYLLKGDNLEVGDKVSIGTEGKAEILLNPGSYVRLGENSGFEFVTTSLDDLQVKLNQGSSIFEVIADNHFKITVNAGKSVFYLIKSGVYRIDVTADGAGKIAVWKGKVQIGDSNATIVKGGKSASLTDGQVAVAKFDKKDKSDLEIWSKSRAKEIAKINEQLVQREMNRSLLSSFGRSGFNGFGGYGLWVFDASNHSSCFLPYSYGWSSPYGISYNQSIWSYSAPANIFYQQNVNNQNMNNQQNNSYQMPPIQTPPSSNGNSYPSNSFPQSPAMPTQNVDVAPARPTITERHQEMQPVDNKRVD